VSDVTSFIASILGVAEVGQDLARIVRGVFAAVALHARRARAPLPAPLPAPRAAPAAAGGAPRRGSVLEELRRVIRDSRGGSARWEGAPPDRGGEREEAGAAFNGSSGAAFSPGREEEATGGGEREGSGAQAVSRFVWQLVAQLPSAMRWELRDARLAVAAAEGAGGEAGGDSALRVRSLAVFRSGRDAAEALDAHDKCAPRPAPRAPRPAPHAAAAAAARGARGARA
jgi:hypothetical protein